MRVKKREDEAFEIPLIPMIDCMLVIIIFFLVATTLKDRKKELPMELPESAAAIERDDSSSTLIISIDKSGDVYLDGEKASTEILHQRLKEVAAKNVSQRIRLDGDRNTSFQDIVRVLDLCQFEGLKNIGIHTGKAYEK